MLSGKVFVTGGAGFLGRGLLRRASQEAWPCEFMAVSRDPQKHDLVRRQYGSTVDVRTTICDILDMGRLTALMTGYDYVIHAAALKHLPECEAQPSQALRVNVDGTRSVMAAASQAGVKRVVCVSTDKAAAPMNVYGMTKALVEHMIFETISSPFSDTSFSGVRYGNVIGSTGSIWPVWKRQAEEDGHLTVTDPSMTRFFIAVDAAIDVILAAISTPEGTIVIPSPQALNIGDLADHLTDSWKLAEPVIVGMRPGEKSHEAMLSMVELDRLELNEGIGFPILLGPTVKPDRVWEMTGYLSEKAHLLTAEEFVVLAEDSESV